MSQNTTTGGSRNVVTRTRRVRRRFRMAGRLRPAEEGRLRRLRRPAFDDLVGRRCGGDEAILAAQDGPAILVGHSYGGVVITEAGNDPKVAGLVYIAAFVPDRGESVSALIANAPPGVPVPPILVPQDGFLLLDRTKFRASFAEDVNADAAAFMADSQVPWGLEALNGAVTEPAWRTKPSWYLVAIEDKMIPPDAQRAMATRAASTVAEARGSHAVYVSKPRAVAQLIAQAATALTLATQ